MVRILLILFLVLESCSPEKKIQRIVKRNPELIQKDTIVLHDTVFTETYRFDTTTVIVPHKETTVINNENVRLIYRYDTITKEIRHEVECKGDTIIKVHEIPVETIKIETKKRIDFKFWGLLVCVVLGLVAFLIKGR